MRNEELADLLGRHASSHGVPGAAVGILREGVATTAFYGIADVRTGAPITPTSQFHIGSLTKSMVATVIARLADAGAMSLDDAVAAHVPELRGRDWARRATIKDLLANRSGIPLTSDLEFGFDTRGDTLSQLAQDVAAQVPADDHWSYSNAGWSLLGRVLETATDSRWEDAMRRHLFAPAGLNDTVFGRSPHVVAGHEVTPDGLEAVEPSGLAGIRARGHDDRLHRWRSPRIRPVAPRGRAAGTVARLAVRHLDPRLVRCVVPRVGVVRLARRPRVGLGRRAQRRTRGATDHSLARCRSRPPHQQRHRTRDISVALRGTHAFGVRQSPVPPLRLEPATDITLDFSKYTGTYAWPDRRVDISATPYGLRVKTDDGETDALAINERTFVVDPADPDCPSITFDAFDFAGRPNVVYLMLWGLSRLTAK
jgi:CubicO group peptidase (beta-lactamase class C family)